MTEQPFWQAASRLGRADLDRFEAVIRSAVPTVAPALAISVWRSGVPWYEACSGWVDPESASTPVDAGTLFDLASLTKLFTATVFLRLAGERKIDLDDPVVRVLPEFGAAGRRAVDGGQDPLTRALLPTPPERRELLVDPAAVTFRQLLTHTGGLASWRSVFRAAGPVPPPPKAPDVSPPEVRHAAAIAAICAYPFVAPPGEEFHYSDLGFMLLGEVVRRLYGDSLDVAVQALIADTLGIDSLGYAPVRSGRSRDQVAPTSVDDDWRLRRCWGEVEDENAAGMGGVAGHAGLFATAQDVARFGVAWLNADPRLGSAAAGGAARSDQTSGLDAARGLGWQVQPTDHLAPFSAAAYGHTGFTGTSLAVDPERDLVVALLTNRVYAGRSHEGMEGLRLDLHRIAAEAVG